MIHRTRGRLLMAAGIAILIPFLLSVAPYAGPSQQPQQPADSPLAPLGFLIGKWEETRLSPSDDDTGRRNHLEMVWDLEGAVIRRSEVRSEDGKRWQGTGIIAWNPVSKRIEFQEHADWGNFLRGTIDVLGEGTVRRNMEVSYPDGTTVGVSNDRRQARPGDSRPDWIPLEEKNRCAALESRRPLSARRF